jgi:hypothetical protein
MRGVGADVSEYPLDYPMRQLHVAVREAEHHKSTPFQPTVARGLSLDIVEGCGVDSAIQFDNQPMLKAGKIDHVGTDRDLAAELQRFHSPTT